MQLEDIARCCHEANKALCESFGDFSQPLWEQAAEWQRESAVAGVKFRLEHPHATAEQQHDQWCRDKRDAGWTCGAKKDAEKKTHPCLVSYERLPKEQQAKDAVFGAIVDALAGLIH